MIFALYLSIFLCAYCVQAYIHTRPLNSLTRSSSRSQLYSSPPLDNITKERLDTVISKNKVVLFMKGNKITPQW